MSIIAKKVEERGEEIETAVSRRNMETGREKREGEGGERNSNEI